MLLNVMIPCYKQILLPIFSPFTKRLLVIGLPLASVAIIKVKCICNSFQQQILNISLLQFGLFWLFCFVFYQMVSLVEG